ncbi:winged helix-turn-helix transcriptional regulator [Gryllotalpicola reticulitermitis]|uniref:Winged helix-turn-helix transcriptional regulator n=1 Tax=Gryllotalpicola reticulitermitis TaxID=1184153 RepID=A0ABV8Q4Y8_9MICO
MAKVPENPCSVARSLGVLGERWTFLILRDAFEGVTRFDEFRESLGIATDVLTARLATLVEYGVMEKAEYHEPGARRRYSYLLTPAGRELFVIIAGLQQWGDRHLPWRGGPSLLRVDATTGEPVHLGFIGTDGREVAADDVAMIPTASYPRDRLAARQSAAARGSRSPARHLLSRIE